MFAIQLIDNQKNKNTANNTLPSKVLKTQPAKPTQGGSANVDPKIYKYPFAASSNALVSLLPAGAKNS